MSKIVDRTINRRDRMLRIFGEVLRQGGKASFKDLAKKYDTSVDSIRRDCQEIVDIIGEDVVKIEWGKLVLIESKKENREVVQNIKINSILTLKEAARKWKVNESILRYELKKGLNGIFRSQFEKGMVRQTDRLWLIAEEAMREVYGDESSEE